MLINVCRLFAISSTYNYIPRFLLPHYQRTQIENKMYKVIEASADLKQLWTIFSIYKIFFYISLRQVLQEYLPVEVENQVEIISGNNFGTYLMEIIEFINTFTKICFLNKLLCCLFIINFYQFKCYSFCKDKTCACAAHKENFHHTFKLHRTFAALTSWVW